MPRLEDHIFVDPHLRAVSLDGVALAMAQEEVLVERRRQGEAPRLR
ncbi:MAG: hypothetical protein ACXVRU_06565 [Gaiellaceae bacterium]